MKGKQIAVTLILAMSLSTAVGVALAAQQDKYALKVPGGLAFSSW